MSAAVLIVRTLGLLRRARVRCNRRAVKIYSRAQRQRSAFDCYYRDYAQL
jgi:hypothetical protein